MTKLKLVWRDSLTEEDRAYWRTQFDSARSQADLRQELLDKYNLELRHDTQLGRFREWVDEQDFFAKVARQAAADWEELIKQGLSGEQLREELLKRMKARAIARGDFKLGAKAIRLDLAADRIALTDRSVTVQEKRLAHLEKAGEDAAQPGGLTPEVLEKIERELKLM